jgi:hypothetical protein
MNSLSYLIYLIQVTGTLHVIGGGILIATAVVCIVGFLAWAITEGDFDPIEHKHLRYPIITAIVGGLLLTFVPSERTMLLIASSQIGEKIIQSETVQSVVDPSTDLLKSWIALETKKIKEQLTSEKK